jgi:nucleotide-binding universal stress UspA family protein
MNVRPSILCPVDFSAPSVSALRIAGAIAAQASARLIVLTVEDPLLTEAMDLGAGIVWNADDTKKELRKFAERVFGPDSAMLTALEYDVVVGKPAPEILRVARERSCDLTVMSSHGLTGVRKLFFGSTTERVLRETTKPVLVTPPEAAEMSFEQWRAHLRRILVPVDLSDASLAQVQTARKLAEALKVGIIVLHVIEPVKSHLAAKLNLAGIDGDRRAIAEDGLHALLATLPRKLHAEALIAYGDPAEELTKVVHDRHAGLVVIGLHSSPMLGPRMGSVTYRVLCLSRTPVLALPPHYVAPVLTEPCASTLTVGGDPA